MLIVGAKMKGTFDLATAIGWEARRFHHMKQPKALAEYLKPPLTPEQKRAKGERELLARFKRLAKKQKKETGDGPR